NDYRSTKSSLRLLELASGKELAKLDCPEKERYFSAGSFSPDGVLLPVHLGGKKGAPVEVWFLDAKTLENRDKLIGTGDPDGRGFSTGVFTRDGKRFVILDGIGNILLWNVAGRKLERTLPTGSHRPSWQLTFSPDGRTAAVGWMPKIDKELESLRDADPQDLPQPRVSLIDLSGNAPPRILIAPHGYVGNLAFSPDGKLLAFGGAGAVHLFDSTK